MSTQPQPGQPHQLANGPGCLNIATFIIALLTFAIMLNLEYDKLRLRGLQVPVGVTLSVGKCPKGLERDVITIKSTSTVPLEEVSVGIVNTNSASEVWYRLDTIKPGESKTVMPIEADNFAFSRVPYELGLTDTIVVKAKNLYEIRFPVKDLGKDKLFDRKRDGER